MNHKRIRIGLYSLLLLAALFAAASFLIPYDWNPNPGARFKIAATQVKKDRGYYWITVHLKKAGGKNHDFEKPVRLVTASSEEIEPADFTFSGSPEAGFHEMWVKFWVPAEQTTGALDLRINDGRLRVKSHAPMPSLTDAIMRTFTSPRW